MVQITALWLPIVVSAVFIFLVSFVVHMAATTARTSALRRGRGNGRAAQAERPPGDYMMPCGTGPESMKDPAFIEKMKKGPVVLLTVMKSGPPNMNANLIQWFVFSLVVGVVAAYVAGRALAPGADYRPVFRFAGVTAFVAYSLAQWQDSIWYGRKWSTTIKNNIDGLVRARHRGHVRVAEVKASAGAGSRRFAAQGSRTAAARGGPADLRPLCGTTGVGRPARRDVARRSAARTPSVGSPAARAASTGSPGATVAVCGCPSSQEFDASNWRSRANDTPGDIRGDRATGGVDPAARAECSAVLLGMATTAPSRHRQRRSAPRGSAVCSSSEFQSRFGPRRRYRRR